MLFVDPNVQAQFGYTCSETFTGLIAWVAYWIYPFMVMLFHMRMMCFRYDIHSR